VVSPKIQKPTAVFQPVQEAYTQALKLVNSSEAELKDTISAIADAVEELDKLEALASEQTANVAEHRADMLIKYAAMHETSQALSKVPPVAVCNAAPAPACSLLTESCMDDMAKLRSLLGTGLVGQDNPALQEADKMFQKIMDECSVIKPELNLSPPNTASGGTTGVVVVADAVVDPSIMVDTEPGGKLYRPPPEQSSSADERDTVRKKAKDRTDAARSWANTDDDDLIPMLEETPGWRDAAVPDGLEPEPTSPAPSDDGKTPMAAVAETG